MSNRSYLFEVFQTIFLVVPVPFILFLAGDRFGNKYLNRAQSMLQEKDLIAVTTFGDSLTAFNYLVIGIMFIAFFVRIQANAHAKIFLLFGMFIFLCGVTHVFDVMSIWVTYYWVDALFGNLTAVVSFLAMLQLPLIGSLIIKWKKAYDEGVDIEKLRKELHDAKHEMQKMNFILEDKMNGGK